MNRYLRESTTLVDIARQRPYPSKYAPIVIIDPDEPAYGYAPGVGWSLVIRQVPVISWPSTYYFIDSITSRNYNNLYEYSYTYVKAASDILNPRVIVVYNVGPISDLFISFLDLFPFPFSLTTPETTNERSSFNHRRSNIHCQHWRQSL